MKKLLLLILTTFHILGYSQDTIVKKSPDTLIRNTKKQKDTIQLVKKENFDNSNVFLLSEKNNDNFKTILPILTLILGIFLNRFIDFYIDRRKIKKAGKQWKAELICLESPIKTQIESLSSHRKQIETMDEDIPILNYSSALNCENFGALSKPDLLDYFEKKEKRNYIDSTKLLNQITVFVTNIKDINAMVKNKFESYLADTSSAYSELSVNLGRQQKAFMKCLTIFEAKEIVSAQEQEAIAQFDNLFMEYIVPHVKDGKYSIKKLRDEFYEKYIPILGHNRQNSLFDELTEIAYDAMTSIKKIEMQRTYWLTNIDTISQLYYEQKEALKLLLDDLNKKNCA